MLLPSPGDLARIEEHTASSNSAQKKAAKPKKASGSEKGKSDGVEGVVYKVTSYVTDSLQMCETNSLQVSDTRIVVSVDPPDTSGEDMNLPDRCRVVKLANSVTYDR